MNAKRVKSLLALEVDAHRLTAVELRRTGSGRVEVRKRLQAPLKLDPLTAAPELVGREISDLLRGGQISARNCLLSLPLGQVLTHQMEVPPIEGEDLADFFNLEAERAFPFAPEDLVITTSQFTDAVTGTRRALMMAVSINHMQALEAVLKQARLRLLSVTIGSTALLDAKSQATDAVIAINDSGVELLVASGGGLAAIRPLGGFDDSNRDESLDVDSLARECRITFGRLPRVTRETLGRVRVFGPSAARDELIQHLTPELQTLKIRLQSASLNDQGEVVEGTQGGNPAGVTAAGAAWLLNGTSTLEFLPPRISPLRQLQQRYLAQHGLARLGIAAGAMVLLVVLAFGWQIWHLSSLERKWASIEDRVMALEDIQKKLSTYRPWFDDRAHSLLITRALTEAFPERGDVWMLTLQIKELEDVAGKKEVVVSGRARSMNDLRNVLERLTNLPNVENPQSGGTTEYPGEPLKFDFRYAWNQNVAMATGSRTQDE